MNKICRNIIKKHSLKSSDYTIRYSGNVSDGREIRLYVNRSFYIHITDVLYIRFELATKVMTYYYENDTEYIELTREEFHSRKDYQNYLKEKQIKEEISKLIG